VIRADRDRGSVRLDHDLTSGRRLTRNTIVNIVGYIAPLIVALVTIPLILHGMGTDRFGILTLAWAIIGYFSLFDFGLNRALTKLVAERLGTGAHDEIPDLIWTSLVLMAGLGAVVAGVLVGFVPWIVEHVLNIPDSLKRETLIGFSLLSLAVPFVILSVGLRGVLSAYQKFDLVNWVRIPVGIYFFAAPVPMIYWYGNALHPILAVLIAGRLVALLVQLRMCLNIVPFIGTGVGFRREFIRPLLSYGGWISICNVISPLMIYIDRFFIGAVISTSAVAFYATPNEAATKLWMLPWALLGVLFPAFSTSLVHNPTKATDLFNSSLKYLFAIFFPIILLAINFAFEGLSIWLGVEFAGHSAKILQWMLVGVFLHGMAQIPYAFLQGAGRPDIIAKLHLMELPLYCVVLWQMTRMSGTVGAAMAWTVRLGTDAVVIFLLTTRQLPAVTGKPFHPLRLLCISILLYVPLFLIDSTPIKTGFCGAVMLLFSGYTWFFLFGEKDRNRLLQGRWYGRKERCQ
jgi:O-antigen/teichoic acid export membrane protein